jgi:hypothetical protein
MGTGKWVQVVDEHGDPILDEDFEAVFRFETSHVDARVLNKLLGLRMSSVDGPAQTTVNVSNTVNASPRPMPKLVRPSVTEHVVDAELIAEDAEETEND